MAELLDPNTLFSFTPSSDAQAIEERGQDAKENRYRLHRRFDRLGRLYGDGAVEALMNAKVIVFGLGGVGSFAAEALARSAVGKLTLVDFDEVCVTNANRQLQALKGNIGKSKAELLAERCRLINPQADVRAVQQFYKAERSDALLHCPWDGEYDFVLDCIDNMTAKAHLLATCKERGLPVVASMGAAGKTDPSQIRLADLTQTQGCTMARQLRKILRRNHAFSRDPKVPFDIPAVYSSESRRWPSALSYDGGEGFKCVCPHKNPEHGCDSRSLIDGTAVFVTGSFGLWMAGHVINALTEQADAPAAKAPDRYGYRPSESAAKRQAEALLIEEEADV